MDDFIEDLRKKNYSLSEMAKLLAKTQTPVLEPWQQLSKEEIAEIIKDQLASPLENRR